MSSKVYLIGNDSGEYYGYCYAKEIKKKVLKEREGYISMKVPEEYAMERGYLDVEREIHDMYDICMTVEEEEIMHQSFGDYKCDAAKAVSELYEAVKCLKFTDEEEAKLRPLITFLKNTTHAYEHGIFDEMEYDGETEIYDYKAVARHFIKYCILG